MDIRKLQRAVVDGLEDVKAQNIVVFNTEHLSALFERVIIASGTSNRQTKALASSVRDSVRKSGEKVMAVEGEDNGEWIIVDCGAAVVHIMQPAIRDYYHLEEIWGGKPVRLTKASASTGLVKASEPDVAPRKASAKSGTTAAPKTASKTAKPAPAKTAAKPAVKKPRSAAGTPAQKAQTAQKVANRTAAFKRVAAKTPAKRAETVSATIVVAPRAAAKRTAAKKAAPARKASPRR